nr:dTMP kinase [Chloroflexia bacterium]
MWRSIVGASSKVSGAFIVLEGPEGGGKTVQARRLATTLERAGHRVVLTREPGGTAVGEAVRGILLGHHDYAILPETEALLMSAARAQHVREVIVPAQERGAVVVCDRYVDSTYAYQGGGRHLERNALATVQGFATGGIEPDLKLLLDLPVEIGLRRRHADPAS